MQDHPADTHLQLYLDGELDTDAQRAIDAHIAACPPCRHKLFACQRMCQRVRRTVPTCAEFLSEGEFWGRLAASLPARRRSRWPLVPYMPPLLLSVPGTLWPGVIALLGFLRLLMGLGLLPSVGRLCTTRLIPLLAHPVLEQSLYSWAGWSGQEVVRFVLGGWTRMSVATQDTLILSIALFLFLALFFEVAILYIGWVVCWSGATPSYPNRR